MRYGAGENWECTDFSTPANFPAIIVKAIKRGKLSYGHPNFNQLLTPDALKKPAADANWEKAKANWEKANADWEKANADRDKAYAKTCWALFAVPENRVKAWQD
mgnify:CR=1 FL=1